MDRHTMEAGRRTKTYHNSLPWAFGSGELKHISSLTTPHFRWRNNIEHEVALSE